MWNVEFGIWNFDVRMLRFQIRDPKFEHRDPNIEIRHSKSESQLFHLTNFPGIGRMVSFSFNHNRNFFQITRLLISKLLTY